MTEVKIIVNDPKLIPKKEHDSDAGFDLRADEFVAVNNDSSLTEMNSDYYLLRSGQSILVKTGVKIELPESYEAQIRPRSGLALKHGISIVNSPGTIDSGYRNIIGIILINQGSNDFLINKYDRIAQMVITKLPEVSLVNVNELNVTDRNEGGFGSTGIN
jgi:dUTP pyrophosphatase